MKPKIHFAICISGGFLHITAMQGSDVVFVINKEPRAPIFNVPDYGIVNDFQDVITNKKAKRFCATTFLGFSQSSYVIIFWPSPLNIKIVP